MAEPATTIDAAIDPAATPARAVRPRARGWIHFYSASGAVAVGVVLIVLAGATVGGSAAAACAVYAVTVVGLFSVSATYHRHTWRATRTRLWMKRADHSMIFVFIAGTYTPIAVLAMPPATAALVLVIVWAGAAGGVALKMCWPTAPRWVGVPFYLALGWVAIFMIPELLTGGGVAAVTLLGVGGVMYTVGAVFYATKRPVGWPRTFGYHEFFHALVTAAAICHCVAIWLVLY